MSGWLRRLGELRLSSSVWIVKHGTGEDAEDARYFTGHSGRDRLPRDGERAGKHAAVEGRRSDCPQTSRSGAAAGGGGGRGSGAAAGKVRSPAPGWSRDPDRPEDGTGSAERNPRRRQRAARHRSPEASGHRSPRCPSRAQAGPRAGLGGAPGGAAPPPGSPVQAFLKGQRSRPGKSLSCCQHGKS